LNVAKDYGTAYLDLCVYDTNVCSFNGANAAGYMEADGVHLTGPAAGTTGGGQNALWSIIKSVIGL
jgi:hypothetical protein